MTIRSLDLRDLPNLYRFRDEAIGLDAVRTLTRGNPLGAAGLLAYVNPARHVYAAVDRKSTRLNSSHLKLSRMPSSA